MSKARAAKIMQSVNQHQVKKLLHWDDLQYGQFQMETGTEYLEKMLGSDDFAIGYLSKNSMFWRWWVNHWDKRDEQFINQASGLNLDERLELYAGLHNAKSFRFYPHKAILEDSKVKTTAKKAAA